MKHKSGMPVSFLMMSGIFFYVTHRVVRKNPTAPPENIMPSGAGAALNDDIYEAKRPMGSPFLSSFSVLRNLKSA